MLTVSGLLFYTLCLLLFIWCRFQWKNRQFLKVASSLPPLFKPWPLLGNLYPLVNGMEAFTMLARKGFISSFAQGLKAVSLWAGPLPYIYVLDHNDIHRVLTSSKTSEKSEEYELLEFAAGNGLITAPGPIWKIKRKFMSPLFHQQNVDKLMYVINRNTRRLVAEVSHHVDKEPVDIETFVASSALLQISNLLFGAEFEFKNEREEILMLKRTSEMITDLSAKKHLYLWLRYKPAFEFFCKNDLKEIEAASTKLVYYTEMASRKRCLNEDTNNNNGNNNQKLEDKSTPLNFSDVIDATKKEFPELGNEFSVKSDLITLYLTGTDTTMVTVCSCLLALAYHTEFQDQLYREVHAVMGDRDEVSLEDLQNMSYLDQVFQETLRWAMVLPFVSRKTTEDFKLGDITVPAGNTISVATGMLGMNPKVYPDPEQFNPEHFSADKRASRDPRHFLPLSGGPRGCIGKQFGFAVGKTMIAHMILKYKLSTKMDIYSLKKRFSLDLKNSDGYYVTVTKRAVN